MSSDKIWGNFPSCECVKLVLINSGYDNTASLRCIDEKQIGDLEKYVDQNHWITDQITCEHAKLYGETKFQFLPGHRVTLLDWCQNKLACNEPENKSGVFTIDNPAFSPIVRQIFWHALANYPKPPNTHRFLQIMIDFATGTSNVTRIVCKI